MRGSLIIKSVLATLFCSAGFPKFQLSRCAGTSYIILTYHRILSDTWQTKGVEPGMYVLRETFESHLKALQKNFKLIKLSQLYTYIKSNRFHDKPFCILTFDDGWKDFYENAYPTLKKYGIPATVFLPTQFIDTDRIFWSDRFSYLLTHKKNFRTIKKYDFHDLPLFVRELLSLSGTFEEQLEFGIIALKKLPLKKIEEILDVLADIWSVENRNHNRLFLNWDEVKEMNASGLISFGSHTASHQILTTLKNEEIEKELSTSKDTLLAKGVVEPSFIPFCYPNGNYTKRIAEFVRSAGYALAVTTHRGWNNFSTNPFELNRISIHEDVSSKLPMFTCRILGIF